MLEEKLEIPAADGSAEAFFYRPDGDGAWPGVLFYTDIFGIRPANQEMAKLVAAAGYAVLMPNVFYRYGRLPLIAPGEDQMAKLPALFAALPGAAMEKDAPFYVETLLDRQDVSGSKVGVVGYCFTGAMSLRTAAVMPDKVAAAASFHGGRLVTEEPDSPHSRIPAVKGELYFGHAVEDQSMTPQQIEKLDDTLKAWGGRYDSEVYEGAKHGWTVPGRDVFNPAQAERHYEKLFELLKRNLG